MRLCYSTAQVRAGTGAEVEAFVHGALCVSYSGQCFSSEAWGGRSANRGQCAQACRLPYGLIVDGEIRVSWWPVEGPSDRGRACWALIWGFWGEGKVAILSGMGRFVVNPQSSVQKPALSPAA